MIYDDDVILIIPMMMILSSNGSLVVNISSASVDERLGDRDREFNTLAKYVCLNIIYNRKALWGGKKGKVRISKNMQKVHVRFSYIFSHRSWKTEVFVVSFILSIWAYSFYRSSTEFTKLLPKAK